MKPYMNMTVREWTRWYLADPKRQEHLSPEQLRGLAMLAGSKERREASEARGVKA